MNLKTLNDFATEWGDGFGIVRKDQLRTEAIKWIQVIINSKRDNEFKTFGLNLEYPWHEYPYGKELLTKFIQHFFNIADEDLK